MGNSFVVFATCFFKIALDSVGEDEKQGMMRRSAARLPEITALLLWASVVPNLCAQTARWTMQKANDWYRTQPFLVGSNFVPATAINQLEMWQAESFDPQRIDLELG